MKPDPKAKYAAIAYFRSPVTGKRESIEIAPFSGNLKDHGEDCQTLADVARFRLHLANSCERVPNLMRIEIFQLFKPILVVR